MKVEKTKKHVEQMDRIKEDITSCLKVINKNIIECHDEMFDNYQHFFRKHASVLYRCEVKNEYYNQLLKEINNGDLETLQAYMMDVISTLTQELIEIKIGSSCVGEMKHLAAVLEFEAKQELLVKFTELACNIDI